MDFYAYDFTRVDPLPFLNLGTYPYPGKSFPLDDPHLNYLLEFNTRYMSGNESRGYAFDYARLPTKPRRNRFSVDSFASA